VLVAELLMRIAFAPVPLIEIVLLGVWPAVLGLNSMTEQVVLVADAAACKTAIFPAVKDPALDTPTDSSTDAPISEICFRIEVAREWNIDRMLVFMMFEIARRFGFTKVKMTRQLEASKRPW